MNPTQKRSKKNPQDDGTKLKWQPIQMDSDFDSRGKVGEIDRIILMIENWIHFTNMKEAINEIKKTESPHLNFNQEQKFSFEWHKHDHIYTY